MAYSETILTTQTHPADSTSVTVAFEAIDSDGSIVSTIASVPVEQGSIIVNDDGSVEYPVEDPNALVCVFQVDIQQKKISAENIKKLTALQSTAQKIIDESGLGKDVLIRLDTIKFAETNIVDDLDEQLEKVG